MVQNVAVEVLDELSILEGRAESLLKAIGVARAELKGLRDEGGSPLTCIYELRYVLAAIDNIKTSAAAIETYRKGLVELA